MRLVIGKVGIRKAYMTCTLPELEQLQWSFAFVISLRFPRSSSESAASLAFLCTTGAAELGPSQTSQTPSVPFETAGRAPSSHG